MLSIQKKPAWLNKKISLSDCAQVKVLIKDLRLNTVCQVAQCPNIGECFSRRQATFIILGDVCTRDCRFCGVAKGTPLPVDSDEPGRIALAVKRLGLKHAVITSVTRDDLVDGGALAFARTIASLRRIPGPVTLETLIPDFAGRQESLRLLCRVPADIIAHNVETVPRLYPQVRSRASYERSLEVLRVCKRMAPEIPLKSGLMLGLGELKEEVYTVFDQLLAAGCSLLSIGQYLAPSKNHFPVREYPRLEVFEEYRNEAMRRGFKFVKSAPYVRSSYGAQEYLKAL